ncbi:uncharacterized protein LOC131954185 [Physella acuta]|uniref:uncharacterized protein LOC131954185 n=1 Tax=Physella acuta TaxID=109671 RepID=UPI0027DC3125|nr:uncharacterized protein LOC131954185 [Physella acuta]
MAGVRWTFRQLLHAMVLILVGFLIASYWSVLHSPTPHVLRMTSILHQTVNLQSRDPQSDVRVSGTSEIFTTNFIRVAYDDTYMYSALAHTEPHVRDTRTNVSDTPTVAVVLTPTVAVVLTTFDVGLQTYRCCLLFEDSESITLVVVNSTVRSPDNTGDDTGHDTPRQTVYTVRQHVCDNVIMTSEFRAQYATLTSSTCPPSTSGYVRVGYTTAHPAVAVCVALTQPHAYTPAYVIEWFEVQKTLGVSKVVLYVTPNDANLEAVLKFYKDGNFLELMEFRPPEDVIRNMSRPEVLEMVNVDCRQRLAGYHYVINLNLDEMVIPHRETSLYTLLQEKFAANPGSSKLDFYVADFITSSGPSHPGEMLTVKRYRTSSDPQKTYASRSGHVTRVVDVRRVADMAARGSLTNATQSVTILPEDALIHRYRPCRVEECPTASRTDDVMMRFSTLEVSVMKVL